MVVARYIKRFADPLFASHGLAESMRNELKWVSKELRRYNSIRAKRRRAWRCCMTCQQSRVRDRDEGFCVARRVCAQVALDDIRYLLKESQCGSNERCVVAIYI
jgi:hypothetical protein